MSLRALLIVMVLAWPSVSDAQSLRAISYGVFVGGQFADLHSTKRALDRGYVEVNPLLAGSFPQIAVKKSLLSAGCLFGAWWLDRHGHPKLANGIRFGGGGVGVAAAIHNQRVIR